MRVLDVSLINVRAKEASAQKVRAKTIFLVSAVAGYVLEPVEQTLTIGSSFQGDPIVLFSTIESNVSLDGEVFKTHIVFDTLDSDITIESSYDADTILNLTHLESGVSLSGGVDSEMIGVVANVYRAINTNSFFGNEFVHVISSLETFVPLSTSVTEEVAGEIKQINTSIITNSEYDVTVIQ